MIRFSCTINGLSSRPTRHREMTPLAPARPASDPLPLLLANTISIDRSGTARDTFADHEGLGNWIATVAGTSTLFPPRPDDDVATAAQRTRLMNLRDAVRRLAAEKTCDPRLTGSSPIEQADAATRIINRSSSLSAIWPELHNTDLSTSSVEAWSHGSFIDALTTVIARRAVELISSDQWNRLQPCLAPTCAHYFLRDAARRQWCTPACGNRARVARHAMRHRIAIERR